MAKERRGRNESKEEKFRRIATKRTRRILDNLRLLGNCARTHTYSYSEDDIDKIFSAIDKEYKRVKMLFDKTKKRHKFSLE